ncbi:MAG: ABC transporter permease subunit, partial [Planctomycetes bacterium]|nr:ABC transporter permease subunit [Planctomycetota bacterium]
TYAKTETGGAAEFRYTFENRSYFNGLTFALYAFYFGFLLLLPIFAATEGGAQLAGETSSRTLHLLLTRPVGRARILSTKLATAAGFVFVLTGLFLAASLAIGLFAVGLGDLDLYPGVLQMTDRHQLLPQHDALVRFLLAWPAASLALLAPLSLSLLLSTWMKSAVNAVGASVALYLVLYVISEIHFFRDLRPFLFTTYLAYWRALFRESIAWRPFLADGAKLMAFTCSFLGLAFWRFRTREET